MAAPYGAELVYRGKVSSDLTGEARDHELIVIAKFPSLASIEEWYGSEAYRPLMALRDDAADVRMTSYAVMD